MTLCSKQPFSYTNLGGRLNIKIYYDSVVLSHIKRHKTTE